MTRYAFFLGGRDLEMVTIAALLRERQAGGDVRIVQVADAGLAWGAQASDYGGQIAAAAARGEVPVLVELTADMPLPRGTIEIDHHGPRCAEPPALRQVFDLLALPGAEWTREMALVAANDSGHVAGMRAVGATDDEIRRIRAADRAAQGITAQEEAEGLRALAARRPALEGTLWVIRLNHGRSATVADPLALAGDGRDLLLLSPASTQFFGAGARIARLDAAFPGGWRGGALPLRGFWGLARPLDEAAALAALG
ncbi:hypothetical protein [Tabrizicola fusiformis]|uniref:hypothetical protein n=1 Tax=Tabrizicola sp. SY72 TaxID=2741673 RepID=UPI001574DCA0|nr:hypothetical protein [Tabrizicola sp. SY72]NTT85942.1 hypothetical protein [Tabrizicola sp. SY72]